MPGLWPVPPNSGLNTLIDGRYRLRYSLGEGGLAEVFYAEDTRQSSKIVALKLMHKALLTDKEACEQFRHEAAILRRLSHAWILRVYDFQMNENEAYLVTDFARAGSLQDLIHPDPNGLPTPLPVEQVADLLERIASGLDYLHSERLAHRDLKPANILLLADDQPVIADVSLALPLNSQTPAEMIKADAWGTPSYAAPEVWDDQAGRASDIYSLGVMLYEMLTGYTPYIGTPAELKELHRNARIPKLSEAPSGLSFPQPIENLIVEALAKAPTYRPRSAGEVYRRFRAAITPESSPPVSATPTSYSNRLAALASQPQPPAAISQPLSGVRVQPAQKVEVYQFLFMIVGIPLIAVFVLLYLFLSNRPSNNSDYDPSYTPYPTPTVAYVTSTDGTTFVKNAYYSSSIGGIAWSVSEPNTFYSVGEGALRTWQVAGSAVLPTLQEPEVIGSRVDALAVSPDGKNVAVSLSSGVVQFHSKTSGFQTVIKTDNSAVDVLAFSPDNQTLATASSSQVDFWNVADGRNLKTLNPNLRVISDIAWSPDGQILAIGVASQVQLWSKNGQLLNTLIDHTLGVNKLAWSPDGQILASSGKDANLIVWKRDGTLVKALNMRGNSSNPIYITGVAFSPDGKLVFATGNNNLIYRWETTTFAPLKSLEGPSHETFNRLVFSPDGERLLTASSNELAIWPKTVWSK